MNGLKWTFLSVSALCLAPVLSQAQTGVWKHYDSLQVTGRERLQDGLQSTFRATGAHGLFAYQTDRGVEGYLNGLPRHEIVTPQGTFTWLDSTPQWTLQLPETALPELARLFQPLRATPRELHGDRFTLEQKFGQAIRNDGLATFCGRPCEILTVAGTDANGARQNQHLWVDSETGLILRREEGNGKQTEYLCALETFAPNPAADASTFQIPNGTKTIRGVVNPEILRHTGETPNAAAALASLRKKSRRSQGDWIKELPAPSGFTFMQMFLKEDGDPGPAPDLGVDSYLSTRWNLSSTLYRLNALNTTVDTAYMGELGDGPQNTTENTGRETVNEQPLYWASRVLVEQEVDKLVEDEATKCTNQTVSPYTYNSGLYWVDPTAMPQMPPDYTSRVETDFLDKATGDTVSFFQLHNRDWKALLHGMQAQTAPLLQSRTRGVVEAYNVSAPYPLHIIVWHENIMEYVLVSNRLEGSQLLPLIETIPMLNTYYENLTRF